MSTLVAFDTAETSDTSDMTTRTAGQRATLALITLYQGFRFGRPSTCRYFPTCSVYGAEAIELHGLWRGSRLALRRVLRCHPWGSSGVDLVPPAIDRTRGPR